MMIQQRNIELDKKSSIQQCYNDTKCYVKTTFTRINHVIITLCVKHLFQCLSYDHFIWYLIYP